MTETAYRRRVCWCLVRRHVEWRTLFASVCQ